VLAERKYYDDYDFNIDKQYNQYNYSKIEEISKSFKEDYRKSSRKKTISFFVGTILGIIFVFAALSLIVYNYARINEVRYNIYSIKTEINQLNIEIEELNSKLDGTITLDNIEKIAIEDLGMQYPQPEQILYINSQWNYKLDDVEKDSEEKSIEISSNADIKEKSKEAIVIEKVISYASKIDQIINK